MIKITRAKSNDAHEVLAFIKMVGAETDNLRFDGKGLDISITEQANFFASIEKSSTKAFFVAREDGLVVGTGNYNGFAKNRISHRGEFGMSVRKSHWNKGIGTLLLETILDFAKSSARSEIVSLEVRSDNLAAIHLYKKFGFERIGTFKGYFKVNGKLVDCDLMQLIF